VTEKNCNQMQVCRRFIGLPTQSFISFLFESIWNVFPIFENFSCHCKTNETICSSSSLLDAPAEWNNLCTVTWLQKSTQAMWSFISLAPTVYHIHRRQNSSSNVKNDFSCKPAPARSSSLISRLIRAASSRDFISKSVTINWYKNGRKIHVKPPVTDLGFRWFYF
jgi:hypothetical protein